MNTIQDFIQAASKNLGVSEQTSRAATGGLLQTIKGQLSGGDFQQLLGKIPGASDVLSAGPASGGAGGGAPAEPTPKPGASAPGMGGGALGGLMSAAGGGLGGKIGGAAGLAGLLGGSGLDASKATGFVSMFADFLKQKAGGDLFNRILSAVPQLKALAG